LAEEQDYLKHAQSNHKNFTRQEIGYSVQKSC